jgi:hypothetical protein
LVSPQRVTDSKTSNAKNSGAGFEWMAAALELVNIVAADPVQILDMLDGVSRHDILLSDRGWFPGQLAYGLYWSLASP